MKFRYLIVYCEKDRLLWGNDFEKLPCKFINAKTKEQALDKFKEKFPQYKVIAIR